MGKNLIFEDKQNIMILGKNGTLVSPHEGDFSVSLVRYKLEDIVFSKHKKDIWFYIDLIQLIVYAGNINKDEKINKKEIEELLTAILINKDSKKSVYDHIALKQASNGIFHYKWKSGQYKIILYNLRNFYNKNGINLADYIKENSLEKK